MKNEIHNLIQKKNCVEPKTEPITQIRLGQIPLTLSVGLTMILVGLRSLIKACVKEYD